MVQYVVKVNMFPETKPDTTPALRAATSPFAVASWEL